MTGYDLAPDSQVWVCAACGKTSRSRYGFDVNGDRVASGGWDESCMMNAVLCHAPRGLDGWKPIVSDEERKDMLVKLFTGEP